MIVTEVFVGFRKALDSQSSEQKLGELKARFRRVHQDFSARSQTRAYLKFCGFLFVRRGCTDNVQTSITTSIQSIDVRSGFAVEVRVNEAV